MSSADKTPQIAISDIHDGSMSVGVDDDVRLANRTAFLHRYDVSPAQTVLVHLKYDSDDYRRYFTVTSQVAGDGIVTPSSIVADALFTTDRNLALLLPVADCIGAVIHDRLSGAMGLAHLGRHNLVQMGGERIIRYMAEAFGSAPRDITVYLGPAAGRERYPLFDFNNRSLHEVATEQLTGAGILPASITIDSRDTTRDAMLFSHSEFLRGNRAIDGRQAIMAIMRP